MAPSPSVAYAWSNVEFRKGPLCLIGSPHGVNSRRFHCSARVSRRPTCGEVRPSLSHRGWYRFMSPAIMSRPVGDLVARSSRGLAQFGSPLQGEYIE